MERDGEMGAYLAWYDEADWLNRRPMDLVCARDLALCNVECSPGKETHAPLRIRGFVLGQGVQRIGFILIVPDVAITEKRTHKRLEEQSLDVDLPLSS